MIKHYNINNQAYGEFNGGDIIENKPLGFPQDGGKLKVKRSKIKKSRCFVLVE